MSSLHRTQRLCFDIRFAGRALAEDQQEMLGRFARARAPAIIAEVFESVSDARAQWRLERLEVDLGQVVADEAESEWERRLRERLRESLQEHSHAGSNRVAAADAKTSEFLSMGSVARTRRR
jgi:hypothetical protein